MLSLLMADSGSEDEFPPSDDFQPSENGRQNEHTTSQAHSGMATRNCPSRSGRGRGRSENRGGRKRPRVSTEDIDWPNNDENIKLGIKPFKETTGYKGEKDLANAKPVDFLYLFLTKDFWKLITEETNRYADEFFDLQEEELKPHSRFHSWSEISVSEMKAFLSLLLCMGLVEKAEIEDYWASFWPTYTPGFAKIMSRNRFELIMSFFHFVDNSKYVRRGQPGHDCLFKVRPIIDLIVPRFLAVYSPHKELSINEMTITLKGRSMSEDNDQASRYSNKAYVLSESKTGYVLQWFMYADGNDGGVTSRVVRDLLGLHTGKGHDVYMENYNTENDHVLKDNDVCGTGSTVKEQLQSGTVEEVPVDNEDDPVFTPNGKYMTCAWRDTKLITMFSSSVSKCVRTRKTASGYRIIHRPVSMDIYNRFMGGVDRGDQRMKTYIFPHRSKKWYSQIFNALLSISVVNSHIIYTQCNTGPHKPLKAFIQDIITDLLEGYSKKESKRGGRPPAEAGEVPQRLTERHWLYETHERPDCAVCSDRSRPGGRRQTHYRCSQCGVGLCAVPCNETYHTQKDFKLCHLDR